MPRGYRYIVLAAFGWLILCGEQPPKKYAQTSNRANNPATTSQPSEIAYRPYAQRYSDACYNAQNHDTADLCAQWRAAVAAEKAADEAEIAMITAIVGTILSVATVVGLIITIWQTNGALGEARRGNRINLLFERRARREARKADVDQAKALKIAERNAQAAADQVAQFRDAQRAWVRLDIIPYKIFTIYNDGLHFNLDIIAENVGQTVATHFELNARIFFKGQDETDESLYDRIEAQVAEWVMEHSSKALATLLPRDINRQSIIDHIHDDQVPWWTGFGFGAGYAQTLILGAVFYRTQSKPDIMQISWRSWYISDGRGDNPMIFIERNTSDLIGDEIMVSPYSQSTVHEERAT